MRDFKPPLGEAYGSIEAPKGELGFYLISDASEILLVPRVSAQPDQPHDPRDMCLGQTVADVMVILGSIDIVMGEVDR